MTDATAARVEKSLRTLLSVISTLSFPGTTETHLLPHLGERRTETVEEPDPVGMIERERGLIFRYGLGVSICARRTWPMGKCGKLLWGAAAKACAAKPSARTRSAAAVSVILSMTRAVSISATMP